MNSSITLKQKYYSKSLVVIADTALRVLVGVLFAIAGFGKLFAVPGLVGFTGMLDSLGFPVAGLLAVLVGLIEFVGGILLALGVRTDIVGTLLAAVMFVAVIIAHGGDGWGANRYKILVLIVLIKYIGSAGYLSLRNIKVQG